MSKIEVLISTMDRNNIDFVKSMNLTTNAIVVNQNESINNEEDFELNGNQVKLFNRTEKGLSKSRNLAIKNSTADICVIADDDMVYEEDYKEKIEKTYEKYPEADIIAFQVNRIGNEERDKTFRESPSWENFITIMKISSVEITFKRKKIVKNNLSFNENMGAGAEVLDGEENVFLNSAMKKGLKVLYVPVNIAEVDVSESSWHEGFSKSYFKSLGAKFYILSDKFYSIFILQYAFRKYKLYKSNVTFFEAIKLMFNGAKNYRKEHEH